MLTKIKGAMLDPSAISDRLGYTPLNKAGDTMTGILNLGTIGQIKFPAAQNASSDANTLDDYEEGTWTPTIAGLGGGSCTMTSGVSGAYTKVGNLVTVSCAILQWNTKTSLIGYVIVSGLPFTPRSGLRFAGSIAGSPASSMSLNGQLFAGNDGGGSYLWLIGKESTNNTYFHLQDANIGSTGVIYGLTMTYFV